MSFLVRALPLLLCAWGPLAAQNAQPIDDEVLVQQIERHAEPLRAAGKLRTVDVLRGEAATATSCELALAASATERLSPEVVCERAQKSCLLVGHYYPCLECKLWHFTSASGFAVGADGVIATCWHLLADDPTMPGAMLIAAGYDGTVWPVESVLAADEDADVCLLKIGKTGLAPLPVRFGARAGEKVYCFSNPDHMFGFFSEGMLARRYQLGPEPPPLHKGNDAEAADAPPAKKKHTTQWLHVTVEFARGSSGAPILDVFGNCIGIAQSTTTVVHDEEADKPDTQMVARSAVPAEALPALLRAPKAK